MVSPLLGPCTVRELVVAHLEEVLAVLVANVRAEAIPVQLLAGCGVVLLKEVQVDVALVGAHSELVVLCLQVDVHLAAKGEVAEIVDHVGDR